jgi:hypothetical protein
MKDAGMVLGVMEITDDFRSEARGMGMLIEPISDEYPIGYLWREQKYYNSGDILLYFLLENGTVVIVGYDGELFQNELSYLNSYSKRVYVYNRPEEIHKELIPFLIDAGRTAKDLDGGKIPTWEFFVEDFLERKRLTIC